MLRPFLREIVTFIVLVSIGLAIILVFGLPTINNSMPQGNISNVSSYYVSQIPAWIYVKTETIGAMLPDNPINVSVTTTSLDLSQIREIQLDFLGCSQYFPNNTYANPPTSPPENASYQDWANYQKAIEEWANNETQYYEQLNSQARANTLFLENDTSFTNNWWAGLGNMTIPDFSTFSGSIQNLNYSTGGTYDIGITIHKRNGNVIGYGMSDLSYMIKNAITISPMETKYQIQSNNILIGLGYIGVGIPFLLEGIAELREIIKRSAERSSRKVYDGDWE